MAGHKPTTSARPAPTSPTRRFTENTATAERTTTPGLTLARGNDTLPLDLLVLAPIMGRQGIFTENTATAERTTTPGLTLARGNDTLPPHDWRQHQQIEWLARLSRRRRTVDSRHTE